MKKRTKSSKTWLHEHETDPYVQAARKAGYRSRAIYKLIEIDEKDKLFKAGMVLVDLGAAPGSWSEYAIKKIGKKGRIVAIDLLPMESLPGVEFMQGDFNDDATFHQLLETLKPDLSDGVFCDIAANTSGHAVVDQAQCMQLAELTLEFAVRVLKKDGFLLVKIFQGAGFQDYIKALREHFSSVASRKPLASRSRSSEMYLLARGFIRHCEEA
jgi:23S rRNA (uridine2552-2'-O)-methyltransferase